MYHGYVPVTICLQVIRDGTPQLDSTAVPVRTGTVVHVLFRFSSIETLLCSLSVCFVRDHGLDFRQMSYHQIM